MTGALRALSKDADAASAADHARRDVDREAEHRQIEEEREYRLRERRAARGCRTEHDIRSLGCDCNREGELKEIPIVGFEMAIRKLERRVADGRTIVMARVVQREHRGDK